MNKISNGNIELNGGRMAVYVLIALLNLWFFAYYDRVFSLAFIAALLLAALASCVATALAAAEIYAGVEVSHSIADKGEDIQMTLTFNSRRRIPIPFFYVKVYNEWLLEGDEADRYVISLPAARPGVIVKSYRAKTWGTASLGIMDIAIHDYLGLFKVTYAGRSFMPVASVSVRPALRESLRNDYLAHVCNRMVSEEKEDGHSMKRSFLSQPGYQHRPYVPGDPLKLINWKLSARLDKYMVRENEFLKTQVPIIILDPVGIRLLAEPEMMQKAVLLEERVVEAVLSMLDSMVKQTISSKMHFYSDGAWQSREIEDSDQIMALRQEFSQYKFNNSTSPRIPEDIITQGAMIAVFTCALDDALLSEIAKAAGADTAIDIICPETPEKDHENVWLVNESYDFFNPAT